MIVTYNAYNDLRLPLISLSEAINLTFNNLNAVKMLCLLFYRICVECDLCVVDDIFYVTMQDPVFQNHRDCV